VTGLTILNAAQLRELTQLWISAAAQMLLLHLLLNALIHQPAHSYKIFYQNFNFTLFKNPNYLG
jgi:hypothetical protein